MDAGVPEIAGAETTRNGLPLSTLDVKHVMDGEDVVLTVSLSYGGPGRNTVTVDTVRLSPQAPMQIEALCRHGVEPIRVSLVAIPASASYAPSVTSASPPLFVRAEPVGSNASAHRCGRTADVAAIQGLPRRGSPMTSRSGSPVSARQTPYWTRNLAGSGYVGCARGPALPFTGA